MRLKEWLETEKKRQGLRRQDFANRIGVSLQSLQLYLHAGRVPRPKIIAAIARETAGAVTAADFYAVEAGRTVHAFPEKQGAA
jgi:transcriptional regulator with XRE-family HTH domain